MDRLRRDGDSALVLTLLPHGDHGAVVRFLGERSGLVAAFVPGARSKRRRADLLPGTLVALSVRERAPGALPTASLEPIRSRALLAFSADTAAALDYLVHLPALLLAEGEAHPVLFAALDGLLARLAEPGWLAEVARFELALLADLGFGLDLGTCALTGVATDLVGVSPRTGRAVCEAAAAGQPWAKALLPLPAFLAHPAAVPGMADVGAALMLTGHFLLRHVFPEAPRLVPLRARLLDLALGPGAALSHGG